MGAPNLTAAGFIGFYSLYTRAFTSFTGIPIGYRRFLALACLLTLIALAIALPRFRRRPPLLVIIAGVLMAGAFGLQDMVFFGQPTHATHTLAAASAIPMGAGYALYWVLWVSALSKKSPAVALRCIAIGTALGVVAGSMPMLLPEEGVPREALYSIVRYVLLIASTACLFSELSRDPYRPQPRMIDFPSEPETAPEKKSLFPWVSNRTRTIAKQYVLFPAFIYLVMWFTLYAGRYHREANAVGGTWTLLVSSLAICLLLIVLSHYENDSLQFLDLLGDALLFLGLSLNLLFVASAESDELFWMGSLFSNCLVDIVIMGKMAALRSYCGINPERAACFVLAIRELALLAGMVANKAIDPHVMAVADTLLVIASLIGSAVFIALKTYATIREHVLKASRAARAFAWEKRAERGLTDREAEVLEELLEGSTYRAIAQLLCISESTVKTHATHIYGKLGVSSRDELIELYRSFRKQQGTLPSQQSL